METYTYKILEANDLTRTMVVEYISTDDSLSHISLNIPAPDSIDDLDSHVNKYAPQDTWAKIKNPSYNLSSIVGTESSVDPSTIIDTTTTINVVNTQYEIMSQLNDEFLAEQSNTASV